ncbi:MAG: hypothetical protein M3R41_01690 [Pseudomonadota bacterium]|nr:hypothetical protein [Pseudomonadota bacterium]
MTQVGIIGALFSLVALRWAFIQSTNARVAIFVLMLLMHLGASIAYYLYVQDNSADTALYYFDPYHFAGMRGGTGTWFTINLVQTMKTWFNGSYLDYFLIFQSIGFWGLVLIARTIEEVAIELRVEQPTIVYLCLFLPGLYFWTSAIGKDAPLFFASCLALWSAVQIQRRYVGFGFAVALMFPFRPHISLIALIALVGALAFDRRTHIAMRAALAVLVVVAIGIVAATLRSAMQVDVSSLSSVADFLATQNQVNAADGSSLADLPFYVKVFSQLFRPLFVDASGLLGLVASFENLFVILMVGTLVRQWRLVAELTRKVAFFRYAMLFTTVMTFFLSAIFYNVGLGLRQKTMMMPTLIILYVVAVLVMQARRHAAGAGSGGPQTPSRAGLLSSAAGRAFATLRPVAPERGLDLLVPDTDPSAG